MHTRNGFKNRFTTRHKLKFTETVIAVAEWWAAIHASNNLIIVRKYKIKHIIATSSKVDNC